MSVRKPAGSPDSFLSPEDAAREERASFVRRRIEAREQGPLPEARDPAEAWDEEPSAPLASGTHGLRRRSLADLERVPGLDRLPVVSAPPSSGGASVAGRPVGAASLPVVIADDDGPPRPMSELLQSARMPTVPVTQMGGAGERSSIPPELAAWIVTDADEELPDSSDWKEPARDASRPHDATTKPPPANLSIEALMLAPHDPLPQDLRVVEESDEYPVTPRPPEAGGAPMRTSRAATSTLSEQLAYDRKKDWRSDE